MAPSQLCGVLAFVSLVIMAIVLSLLTRKRGFWEDCSEVCELRSAC